MTDENLQIRGNWIWNGPIDHPLGVGDSEGCAFSNPTCNSEQLVADNSINQSQPEFVDVSAENYRLAEITPPLSISPIPAFGAWTPPVSAGTLTNEVVSDFANQPRGTNTLPGAYGSSHEDNSE